MIIRKPYAFLIKHFKFINLLILIFSSYILYKSVGILDFFNEYVSSRQYLESENLINDIIPTSLILFSGLLIVLCFSITVLFKKKDKPILFYFSSVIYYLVLIVILFISRNMIHTIMYDGLDPRISRIIRDVWLITTILQVVVVVFSLIRTLGFDVKKFNFGDDVHELQIDDEDNEEVEITTKFDADKVKMKAAMQREELKAFFYENKFMIILILVLLFGVIPSVFIARNIVENKRYKVGEVIDLEKFNFKITNAYVTKRDYSGKTLFTGENSYLIVSFNIENFTDKERGINLNNLRLEINDKIYMPKTNYYNFFSDIGTGYEDYKIGKESKDYIAVYVISDKDLKSEMVIRYADKLTVKNDKINAVYYRTIINPKNMDIDSTLVNRKVNDDLIANFKKIGETKLNISHYNLKDKFSYEVNGKTKYIINSTGLVLSLNYNFTSSIKFIDFVNDYVTLTYKYNDLNYSQKLKYITMTSNSKTAYFGVNENLKDASEISLVVNTRNTKYVYKLK